jgi:hypothetical protein
MIAAMAAKHADVQGYNFSFWVKIRYWMNVETPRKSRQNLVSRSKAFPLRARLTAAACPGALALRNSALAFAGRSGAFAGASRICERHQILLSGVSLGPLLLAALDRYRCILPPPLFHTFRWRAPCGPQNRLFGQWIAGCGPVFAHNLAFGVRLIDGSKQARIVARMNENL